MQKKMQINAINKKDVSTFEREETSFLLSGNDKNQVLSVTG